MFKEIWSHQLVVDDNRSIVLHREHAPNKESALAKKKGVNTINANFSLSYKRLETHF